MSVDIIWKQNPSEVVSYSNALFNDAIDDMRSHLNSEPECTCTSSLFWSLKLLPFNTSLKLLLRYVFQNLYDII